MIIYKASDGKFSTVLLGHNININAELTPDVKLAELKTTALRNFPQGRTACGNDLVTSPECRWRRDMSKCKLSNEAIFQRTIMMEIIERDELNENLDFMCEAPWWAERMPSRNDSGRLAQPKPDLAVAFRTTSLLPVNCSFPSLMRLGQLNGHIFAEGMKKGEIDRAFHFFSIEVKGKRGQIGNTEAEYQNLNTAAQALHNIYVIMKEAELEQDFFEEVRFFSVVATAACFELRVHRPTRPDPDDYIDPKYGVRYSFDEVLTVGSDYTKEMASTVVYNILFHYGVGKLYKILRTALEVVLKKHRGGAAKGIGAVAAATETGRAGRGGRGGRGGTRAAQQVSPPKSKRAGDNDLQESFGSHASQRRRFGNLVVDDEVDASSLVV